MRRLTAALLITLGILTVGAGTASAMTYNSPTASPTMTYNKPAMTYN